VPVPTELSLSKSDIAGLRTHAQFRWGTIPHNSRLEHSGTDLTHDEIVAISWFEAALELLHKKQICKTMVVKLVVDDFQSDTDEGT
jgi:hypothetical protein